MQVLRRTAKSVLSKIQPSFISREEQRLQHIKPLNCDTSHLAAISVNKLHDIINAPEIITEWASVEKEIARLNLPEDSGSMNVGDRHMIYHLVRYLRPKNVLEIGTHIGASTAHFAYALKMLANEDAQNRYHLTTVDIIDVNDPMTQLWTKYGSNLAPKQLLERLGCQDQVTFVAQSSGNFFSKNKERYDFIFLDGNHSATTVYQEIPAALQALAPGGSILLHDFYPNLMPLWSNGVVIPGPWLATQRHKEATPELMVIPFGKLPWPTKLGSNITSLALLSRVPKTE